MLINYDRPPCPSSASLTIEINWQQSSPLRAPSSKAAKLGPVRDNNIPSPFHTSQRLAEIQHSPPLSLPPVPAEENKNLAFTNRKPFYPEEARLLGIEGTVMVKLTINPDGTIQEARPLEPRTHPLLEQAALSQIKGWKFSASSSSYSITVPIKFELED